VSAPRFLDAEAIARLLPPAVAIDALEAALLAGLDPAADPPRSSVAGAAGELLLATHPQETELTGGGVRLPPQAGALVRSSG